MKVIGLIGGMSWTSSLEYYRIINELIAQRLGGFHSALLVLYSLDFEEIERAQREDRWDDAANVLIEAGQAVKQAGADFIMLCCNTMYKVADILIEKVDLPLLHIADVTGNAIKERGLSRVGLLGTQFVMQQPFYKDRLRERFNIEVLVPEESDMAVIHGIIYDELCKEIVQPSSRQACIDIIDKLTTRGAEGIILGCTELPLLIEPDTVDVPIFNTTRLHAEAAVNLALAER